MPLAAGTRLGHYEILGSLGAGGMGEVYRAADRTLGRDVALKILPAETANQPGRLERFQREARAVAALNHPHIVTIYSVEAAALSTGSGQAPSTGSGQAPSTGSGQGVHFLTMELVEGTSLDKQIGASGLPLDTIVPMALQIADALAAAHEKGIVHRDLKPANVMLTASGRVKILDFGLAKVTDVSSQSQLETIAQTSDGVIVGTVPYMSPEQVEGRDVDARSDLFSLGVMLHEMTTGSRPFQGGSHAALMSAILRDVPPSVTLRRSGVPGELGRLISSCLEKDRDRRPQTAQQLRDALDAIWRGASSSAPVVPPAAPARDKRSIVVLPFANFSPDPANEYLGDGLTEEIITDLSKVRALSVISRTSAMQLKGAKKDARTIGRELGVQYVLDGSVRKAGNSLRITAQLVDAAADAPLWSDKFSGTMDDVFEVQERVSREIVKALNITLTSDEHKRLSERPIADARAYELYLQAREQIRRYAPDRVEALVREAVRIEGETPPLMALQIWSKVMQVRAGVSRDRSLLDVADREARELLARMPDAPYGDSLLGHIGYERGRLPEAVHHLKRAIEREPSDSDARLMLVVSYGGAGQIADAMAAAKQMLASDPLSPMSWLANGVPSWFVGRAGDSLSSLARGLEIDPQNFIIHWTIGYAYVLVGRLADASRHGATMHDMAPDVPYTRQLLSLIDGIEGRRGAALERIASLDVRPLDPHHLFHLAESFIMAGEDARGLDLLEQCVSGFHCHEYMAQHCRFLDPVRETPRFKAVLATAKDLCESFASRTASLA